MLNKEDESRQEKESTGSRKTIAGGRAAYAYQAVSEYVKLPVNEEDKTKYRARVVSMPMMIKNNGFGAAMAFYFSKQNDQDRAYKAIYEQITLWLKQSGILAEDEPDLMYKITHSSIDEYKTMTNEAMALLAWMKRFAEGMIKRKKTNRKQPDQAGESDG
ncbi:type III-B CRISPR module-associated protein Cmr5 [Desulfoscipio sp. XC116]|uniref:type III-B CRISPR module-associated protein Cmr5 n=1 Tax=Desulfoscipio sp. XC116 TaxID=3144975 RepID=UPI00325AE5DD